MERFFNKASQNSGKCQNTCKRKGESADLLGQLRDAAVRNNLQPNQQSKSPSSEQSSSSEHLWDPYFSRNSTYSISDISLSNRIANSGKSLQGWKVVDKKRVYTTFRNGKLVQGEGAEGYKLAVGDAPSSKGKKRGPQELSKNSSSDVNENLNENRVTNSRTNSCIIVESSKKVKECSRENSQENFFQRNQGYVSQNGVCDISYN